MVINKSSEMAARDYKKEYRDYHGKPEQIKRRAARNQSRAKLEKAGVDVRGKDVDHKVGLFMEGEVTSWLQATNTSPFFVAHSFTAPVTISRFPY